MKVLLLDATAALTPSGTSNPIMFFFGATTVTFHSHAEDNVQGVSMNDVVTILAPPDFHGIVRPCSLAQYTMMHMAKPQQERLGSSPCTTSTLPSSHTLYQAIYGDNT